jgi:hypothetical protein
LDFLIDRNKQKTHYNNINPAPIIDFAQIYSTSIITDTANWTIISGSFISDSVYQYIIIGNFFSDTNTDTLITGAHQGYGYGSYFFIDDIYLGTDSLTSGESFYDNNSINIFPNPATNELTIDCALTDKSSFELFDLIGIKRNVVALDNSSNIKRIVLTDLDNGLYFYYICNETGDKIKTGKLIIQK